MTTQYSTQTSPYNIFLCIFIAEIKVTFFVINMIFWLDEESILQMAAPVSAAMIL